MKEIKANTKLDAQQQVFARCVEYEEALRDSLHQAKNQLQTQQWINSHTDYCAIANETPKEIEASVKRAVNERNTMCEELEFVIKKIECQLELLPKVRDWLVDNYKNIQEMDIALNGVLGLDVTKERFNELRKN